MIWGQLFAVTWFCTEVHSNSECTKWTSFRVKHLRTYLMINYFIIIHSTHWYSSGQTVIKFLGLEPNNSHIQKCTIVWLHTKSNNNNKKRIHRLKCSVNISSLFNPSVAFWGAYILGHFWLYKLWETLVPTV